MRPMAELERPQQAGLEPREGAVTAHDNIKYDFTI